MKRYTLTDNIISLLVAVAVSIPICVSAYNARKVEEIPVMKTETVKVESEVIDDVKPVETVEVKTVKKEQSEEWIDGGYNDRVYIGSFTTTAYCACEKCCRSSADGITYTGTIATEGRTVSVDPDVIPLGSLIEINGINYVAEDVGGAVKEKHIDIYFESHDEALKYGKQIQDVYMIEECLGDF